MLLGSILDMENASYEDAVKTEIIKAMLVEDSSSLLKITLRRL
jgi:hypothetical protein